MAEPIPPTKKELEKLYHEKGHDALVWYAWRNALRVLPALGVTSLDTIWDEDEIVQHLYAICRMPILLTFWKEFGKAPDFENQIARLLNASASADDDSGVIAALAVAYAASATNFQTYESCISRSAENYGSLFDADIDCMFHDQEIEVTAYEYNYIYENPYSLLRGENYIDADQALVTSAFSDYLKLCSSEEISWRSLPLWSCGEPNKVRKLRFFLTNQINELGFPFLANDINALWESGFLGEYARNYLVDWSETVITDPNQLRRAILFGEPRERVYAVRVLLLGSGGAGKSSLADRLQGKPIEETKLPTVGIDYLQHQSLKLKKTFPHFELQDTKLDLFLWDFGGQTIFHGLHSAFLHENCVYVLVVDSRHEQAPDEWLHQIRHLAGSQAKVLLVTNWYEQCETYQNKTRLLREFPDLLTADSFFYFSCLDKDAPDFKRFVQSLVKASLDSQKMVLKETLDVQRALDAQYKDGDTVFVRESKLRELIAANIQDAKNTDSTLNQLQQLGFLVQVEKGKSRYCLKPAWAVDNAYQLLYSPALRQANGILNLTELEQVFAGKVDEDHVEYLVSFLNERSLCIRLQDNGKYFFPDATRADEPLLVSELLNQQNKLILRFDLPYLPLGFHARLVHKLFVPHSEVGIHDPQNIWRQGFILKAGTTSQAVVHYLLRKNVIEMVLTGDLKAFSSLLREFFTHLKAVLVSPNGIRPEQIHPSVLFNQQSFSVHSGEGLVKVLAQINSYDQIFQEVRKMASTGNINVTNGQVIIGDHNTQKSHSDNTTITVTADQRQIISSVLDEMLRHKANLSDDVLEAVYDVRKAVKTDEKQPTEKSQSVLGKLWGGIRELTNVAKDMTDVGGFVVEHQAAIGTAVTAAAALLS